MSVRVVISDVRPWDGVHRTSIVGVMLQPAMRGECQCGWRGSACHAPTRAESVAMAEVEVQEHLREVEGE